VEHIVQDGASTDDSAEWLAAQPDLDARSEPDTGMYDAINRGWQRAGGDILGWLNVDEQYLPGTLARIAGVFAERPDVDVIFGDVIMVAPDGSPLAARREIPLRSLYIKNAFLYALSAAMFFRRDLWDEGLLRFDSSLKNSGDMELMLGLLAARKRILHVPQYLSLYGIGDNLSVALHDNLVAEGESIARKYGPLPRPLRILARMARWCERALRGCYRTDVVTYEFAQDETPTYRLIPPTRVGFRFTYARAAKQIARLQ